MDTPSPEELHALGALARELAVEAGELALRRRREGVEVAATKSSAADVVTAADQEVESWLRARLAEERPEDAILGEEEGRGAGTSGLTWIIDPIDGTVNYLYGLDAWAISVAVCLGAPDPAGWTLLAGAVRAPAMGTTWHAVRGGGAFRDGEAIGPLAPPALEVALVATGFGYTPERRAAQGRVVAALLPEVRDIRRLGSAAIDLCMVADGTVDAYYESGVNPWDIAGGVIVLSEAGGEAIGLRGGAPSGEMIVAGHGGIAGTLTARLSEYCKGYSRGV